MSSNLTYSTNWMWLSLVERPLGGRKVVGSNPAIQTNGLWRSLEAHLLWEQGVVGSNPTSPTKPSWSNGQGNGFLNRWWGFDSLRGRLTSTYGCSSIGRAAVSKTAGCRFESCHPCHRVVA